MKMKINTAEFTVIEHFEIQTWEAFSRALDTNIGTIWHIEWIDGRSGEIHGEKIGINSFDWAHKQFTATVKKITNLALFGDNSK